MPEINASTLSRYANRPDLEIKVTGEGDGAEITTRDGSLFGRLGRWLDVSVFGSDRAEKQAQYQQGKDAVLAALVRQYGETVGTAAYRENIGHWEMRDGARVHQSSSDFPITGRHIGRMIESAERQVLQRNHVRFLDGAFLNARGRPMTEEATVAWMQNRTRDLTPNAIGQIRDGVLRVERTGDSTYELGTFQVDLRSQKVESDPGRRRMGLDLGASVANDLLADIDTWLGGNAPDACGFWTLDLKVKDTTIGGGTRQQVIGIRVDQGDPDTIIVFDANRRQASVPRSEFAGWLGGHLQDTVPQHDGLQSIETFRAGMNVLQGFSWRNGNWEFAMDSVVENPDRLTSLRETVDQMWQQGLEDDDGFVLCKGFHADCFRQDMLLVRNGQEPLKLDTENATDALVELVARDTGGDGPDPWDQRAAMRSASVMLSQSMVTQMYSTAQRQIGIGNDGVLLDTSGVLERDRASVRREGDDLFFTYQSSGGVKGFVLYGDMHHTHKVSPEHSNVDITMTVRVPIAELERAGHANTPPKYEIVQPPTLHVHLGGYQGEKIAVGQA